MANLELQNVGFGYQQSLVHDLSFALQSGSVTALVGASGSGKTTILKLIAGFLLPKTGKIFISGNMVANSTRGLAPNKRHVGLVFQQHALLPHLTVRANILFGCKQKGAQRERSLERFLSDFRISHLSERFPHQISGGEQQRVALARALVAKPDVLLMDEPFASIDSVLRRTLRRECMDVLRRSGTTALLVTHDAEEALELADHVIVLDQGTIQQTGTPHEVYFYPKTIQVASLFGEINRIIDSDLIAHLGGDLQSHALFIRPEALEFCSTPTALSGLVTHTHFRGNHSIVCVQLDGFGMQLKVHTHRNDYFGGAHVWIRRNA